MQWTVSLDEHEVAILWHALRLYGATQAIEIEAHPHHADPDRAAAEEMQARARALQDEIDGYYRTITA